MITQLLLLCLGLVVPSLGARLPYIIHGTDADIADFPWQCSLRDNYGLQRCGASIISSTWLVTAAHCIGTKGHSVYCGSPYRYSEGIERSVITAIMHEHVGGGGGTLSNDIAVLQVAELPLDGVKMKAVPMWDSTDGEPAGNEDCWITGWGITESGLDPHTLQKANINVYTNSQCSYGPSSINDGHICIGDPANGRGACNGDSGGPLVCKKDGQYKLLGAASWGAPGCNTDSPSVYTRIPYFTEWIRGKTGL